MGKQVQLLRGTTAENNMFTGEEGALTYNTETKAIVVHDGKTQGGGGFIDTVVEFQLPTEENNYTWYRKYASGWVEQGGCVGTTSSTSSVTFPIAMTNNNYSIFTTGQSSGSSKPSDTSTPNKNTVYSYARIIYNKTTTGFDVGGGNEMNQDGFSWQVSGMAADASQSDTPEEPSVLPSQ